MSAFQWSRGGIAHRYEISPQGLRYDSGQTHVDVRWSEIQKLSPGVGPTVDLILQDRPKLSVWLDESQMKLFWEEFFQAWGQSDRGAACKAAFDYGSSSRTMGAVWMIGALLFPGLLALLLLLDGAQTLKCDPLLEHGKIAPAQIIKITKDRRGNTVWKLEFKTESGTTISGKRTAFWHDNKGNPTGNVAVVYAPTEPKCWDLSMNPDTPAINRNQRHFFLLMDLGFGGILAFLSAFGFLIGALKWQRKSPYQQVVLAAGTRISNFPQQLK